jgi:hypothetical protein
LSQTVWILKREMKKGEMVGDSMK